MKIKEVKYYEIKFTGLDGLILETAVAELRRVKIKGYKVNTIYDRAIGFINSARQSFHFCRTVKFCEHIPRPELLTLIRALKHTIKIHSNWSDIDAYQAALKALTPKK